MSWQRIDENTYIDDTLVTCAEYQLFIDEMREQGKYHQPDHWTSYEFPEGRAHEPIFGVRFSDAQAFCEWLTIREASNWRYRVPYQVEANENVLHSSFQLQTGYWGFYDNENSSLLWNELYGNPRMLDNDHVKSYVMQGLVSIGYVHIDDPRERYIKLEEALDTNIDFAVELDLDYTLNVSLNISRMLDQENTVAFTSALGRLNSLSHLRSREDAIDHAVMLTFSFIEAFYHPRLLDRVSYVTKYGLQAFAKQADGYPFAMGLIIDLITLQERIAGRSPAFEGIRLVKYR